MFNPEALAKARSLAPKVTDKPIRLDENASNFWHNFAISPTKEALKLAMMELQVGDKTYFLGSYEE